MRISENRFLHCSLLALILFPFYLYTMSPTVSVGDSGEFIAAAETLALPHAPSYPLFSLIGKCAILLNPFAHLAYQVNLVSAMFGVATAALFFFLARQIGLSIVVALLSTLTFFFSNLLWEHSLTTEVFTLNSFFAVLLLSCFFLKCNLFQKICLISFLFGVGLGNHHTLVLVVPCLLILYFRELILQGTPLPLWERVWVRGIRCLPFSILFFIVGFSIYLYLPLRSVKNPPMDWSNPETLQNFVRVITRADYGSLALTLGEKMPRNLETISRQIERYVSNLGQEISWVGFILGCLGWFLWFWKDKWSALAFFVFFIISGIGFLLLGNLPFDSQSNGILPRFYLLPTIPFMLAIGQFFEGMLSFWRRPESKVFLLLGFLLPAFLFFNAHGHRTFSRHDFAAYDYGNNILRTLPRGAILFMDGGDDTFYTLAYLTMAEKKREDLALHDRGGLIYRNPYGDDFRRITKQEKETRRQQVESSYLGVRPLYYSTFNRQILKGARIVQSGILYQAVPINPLIPSSLPITDYRLPMTTSHEWHFYSYRGIYESNPHLPYRLRALVPIYPFLQGLSFWSSSPLRGEEGSLRVRSGVSETNGEGEKYLRRSAGFGTDILWLQSNLTWDASFRAYELTNQNKISEAEKLYQFVIEVDPKFVSAYSNLGVLAERRNEDQLAESYYRKAIESDPKYAEAYYNLGVLYWKQNRWEDVIAMFEKTLQFNPNHPSAPRYLFLARQKVLGRR